MNKKIVVTVLTLAAILLATPYIGAVYAGKGQDKLDFLLHLEGKTQGPPEKAWTTDGGITHIRGLPWVITGDFYVEIGTGATKETITKDYLSYSGSLDIELNTKQGWYVATIRETITIYTSPAQATERGTLEILNMGHTNTGGNSMFDGHGTGAFEGVKLHGTSTSAGIPAVSLVLNRVGTVMGWQ